MDPFWSTVVSSGLAVAAIIVARALASRLLPARWKTWLRRWRGVMTAGVLGTLATVAISLGIAILAQADHFGTATPKDAYVAGPVMICLGLIVAGFAVAGYRNNPVR